MSNSIIVYLSWALLTHSVISAYFQTIGNRTNKQHGIVADDLILSTLI